MIQAIHQPVWRDDHHEFEYLPGVPMKVFNEKYGFSRSDVGLHNWRIRPYSRYAFQHVSEFVPSSIIPTTAHQGKPPEYDAGMESEAANSLISGETLGAFLTRSQTDRFLVSKAGRLIMNWSPDLGDQDLPHIAFSVSKSFTGALVGIVSSQGLLNVNKTVSFYLPEAASSGFGDCSIQHILDMRVSLDFTEDYLDKNSDYARYREATLWNPRRSDEQSKSLEDLLMTIPGGSAPHGGPFHYLSPNSDILGILLERVTGTTYAELMSELLWKPMGALSNGYMTVDARGAPRGAGGLSIAGHDLMAFGELLLNGGSTGFRQIVPESWIDDTLNNGDTNAWAKGNFSHFLPGGRYRNQWYQLAPPSMAFMAIGIHGQWLFIDPATKLVIVKLSSQELPQNDGLDLETVQVLSNLAIAI